MMIIMNIYNFSYYGLFSPVVLIGYLLPNVKMSDYMMVASIVCLAAAVIILYRWLKSREFTAAVSGMTALMFLFAGPMIYQSSHQIMFVNYMPFLFLMLRSIDHYFINHHFTGIIIWGSCIVLHSYFYCVGCFIVCLFILCFIVIVIKTIKNIFYI